MNNVNILKLEESRAAFLEEQGLDAQMLRDFHQSISKNVSEEEKTRLGKELFEMLVAKTYYETRFRDGYIADGPSDFSYAFDLIQAGADVNYRDEGKGDFPLLICARKNYLKTFLCLIKAGADINQQNNYLTTATMAAARHGNKEMLKILILMKADINAKSLDGDNALISARKHNQVECFNMLVESGAHLNIISQDGRSIYTFKENEKFYIPLLESSIIKEQTEKCSLEATQKLLDEAYLELNSINENASSSSFSTEGSIDDKIKKLKKFDKILNIRKI